MSLRLFILLHLALAGACLGATKPAPPPPLLQDPWDESYANLDATGPHVLGCWKFDELPLADASGRGAQLMVDRSFLVPEGRFGGGLKCGSPARVAVAHPHHTPQGGFSAEMWVRPAASPVMQKTVCLLDKQGARMEEFSWNLLPPNERGLRQMMVRLGFGTFAKEFVSEPVWLPVDEWRHLAFSYDGAGKVVFHLNAQAAGESFEERCGPVVSGAQALYLGYSSAGTAAFQGIMDEVRLCSGVRGFAAFALSIDGTSHVWERMERAPPMVITCTNLRRVALRAANMTFSVDDETQSFIFPDLEPGATNVNEFGPDTALKPGSYVLEVAIGTGLSRTSRTQPFQITPRRSHMLPVVLDGVAAEDLLQLEELACTHWTGIRNDDAPYVGAANKYHPLAVRPRLEVGLLHGMHTVATLDHDQIMLSRGMSKAGRDGNEYTPPEVNAAAALAADLVESCGNMFTVYYRTFGCWNGVMFGSSYAGGWNPSFSKPEQEAYRKFSGQDIPAEVQGDTVHWEKLPGFAQDRMIPDEHLVLKYYRWFWSEGNGRSAVNKAWFKAYERRKQSHAETWSMHHPSVRQPSKAGAFNGVVSIGDQSRDTRDPLMAGLCMDQQLAMRAAHKREMGVFGILPLAWERALVSPLGADGTASSILEVDRLTPAQRITMAPALLRENLWVLLSRPLKGLVLTEGASICAATACTHPQSQAAARDVAQRLLLPLGPMLGRRQVWRSPVVLLESFTAQVMAGRGLFRGGASSTLELWQALQRAHIQADIVYEESLMDGALDGRQILLMPDCDVLPASVVERIRDWQKSGGKVLADDHLCPALKADASWIQPPPLKPAQPPDASTPPAEPPPPLPPLPPLPLPARLTTLCKDHGWQPKVSCDSADVILHASQTGEALCLFVINDRREPGTYVGQHALVRESALPVTTHLNLGHDKVNVYDLTHSTFLLPKRDNSGLIIPLKLGPSEGRVLLLSPVPLLEMQTEVPETATRGNAAEVRVRLLTSGGMPMPAAIPVAVSIRDADGAPAEFDGHHVAENGELTLRLDLARNETPGTWEIHIRELASGMEAVKWLQVTP